MKSVKRDLHLGVFILLFLLISQCTSWAQIGIWTSAEELGKLPASGPVWEAVFAGAQHDFSKPDLANQNDNRNVYALAAGIVYARTGDESYKSKVVAACQRLAAKGQPLGVTLAWAREVGAYAMAADLAGYRTPEFEAWLRNMAEIYIAADSLTLLEMFKKRPNNWGAHAFGSLCAIYRYLGESTRVHEIRDYWIRGVLGPNPGFSYEGNFSWHLAPNNPRLINPRHAVIENFNIDGIIPDDMRRGGPRQNPPIYTGYPWEFLQGQLMAARILERAGLAIWAVGDSALFRAAYALQVRLENAYGGWAATGDDEWMLPFFDQAYGTKWSSTQARLWGFGKSAGWGYVVWNGQSGNAGGENPRAFQLDQNHPNPFTRATTLSYRLLKEASVNLDIYDVEGQLVSTLCRGVQNAGSYAYAWEGLDSNGRQLPGGIYFCHLEAGTQSQTIKTVLLR